jgi:hypothetical protein
MTVYCFIVYIDGEPKDMDDIADRLAEAGCNDGLLESTNGNLYIDFQRPGADYQNTVETTVRQVEGAGLTVRMVHLDNDYVLTDWDLT